MNNNGEKQIIGRRPKQKDATGLNNPTKALTTLSTIKRLCSNPLDRLCEMLLDWDISAFRLSKRNEEEIIRPEYAKLPLIFQNFHEYITLWEPLMIEEMRENVKSNYRTKPSREIKKGTIQFKSADRLPHTMHTVEAVATPANGNPNDSEK